MDENWKNSVCKDYVETEKRRIKGTFWCNSNKSQPRWMSESSPQEKLLETRGIRGQAKIDTSPLSQQAACQSQDTVFLGIDDH